jgi:long-subunit fatty acid transport protein
LKQTTALLLFLLGVVSLAADVHAQEISLTQTRINSSPNPIGSGARAQGMGGAFIAIADDATAASWNPGGLMQLERPEFSFVFNSSRNRKEVNNSSVSSMDGMNSISRNDLNYLSFDLPFRAFNKNMVISLNYQRLYDLYDDLSFDINKGSFNRVSGGFTSTNTHTDFKQSGALKAFAPAYAIQITPQLSVGATCNFWTDNLGYDNEWESHRVDKTTSAVFSPSIPNKVFRGEKIISTHEENTNFEAFNMNLGFLWRINSVVTLGGVYKTPYTASVVRRTWQDSETHNIGGGATGSGNFIKSTKTRERIEMHFPSSYGLGIAFRLTDAFTTSFDLYRTEWSDYWIRSNGRKTSPVTGGDMTKSHTKDTTQVRAGCEYLFVLEKTIIPLRGGVFYDPEPAAKHPDDFYGFSLGTGISLGPVVVDCAYIYRWGRSVKGNQIGEPDTKLNIKQHNIYVSMIYHF